MSKLYTKLCGFCGEMFCTTRHWVKYCSPECQKAKGGFFTTTKKRVINRNTTVVKVG